MSEKRQTVCDLTQSDLRKKTNFIVTEQFQTCNCDTPKFKDLFKEYFDEIYNKD